MTTAIRKRTPAERAQRRNEEKRLADRISVAARDLADARDNDEITLRRAQLMTATRDLHRLWGIP